MMTRKIPRYVKEEAKRKRSVTGTPRILPADPSAQLPSRGYSSPPSYYIDYPFRCVDCGSEEVWTADQQKKWFEDFKGPIQSRAVRCLACRRKCRERHGGTPRKSARERYLARVRRAGLSVEDID